MRRDTTITTSDQFIVVPIDTSDSLRDTQLVLDNWSHSELEMDYNIEKQLIRKISDYSVIANQLISCKTIYMNIVRSTGGIDFIRNYYKMDGFLLIQF
jgi:hypothetical protein